MFVKCYIMIEVLNMHLQDAILDMDDSIIDQVENLLKICPTKEEMEILKVNP